MGRKRRIILEPKSLLGLDKKMFICWNCMFWNHQTGHCPWSEEDFDYNQHCKHYTLFRYNLDYKFYRDDL